MAITEQQVQTALKEHHRSRTPARTSSPPSRRATSRSTATTCRSTSSSAIRRRARSSRSASRSSQQAEDASRASATSSVNVTMQDRLARGAARREADAGSEEHHRRRLGQGRRGQVHHRGEPGARARRRGRQRSACSTPTSTGRRSRSCSASPAGPNPNDGKTLEPMEGHGLQAMSIGFLIDVDTPMVWRGPMVTQALEQLLNDTHWRDLDYLVVDLPPGTGDIQLTLAQKVPVTGAVIVTTPQDIALIDARKGLKMFEKVGIPILGIVENMSIHICSELRPRGAHLRRRRRREDVQGLRHRVPRRAAARHPHPRAGRFGQADRGGRPGRPGRRRSTSRSRAASRSRSPEQAQDHDVEVSRTSSSRTPDRRPCDQVQRCGVRSNRESGRQAVVLSSCIRSTVTSMSIKSDSWIRRMAAEHSMIEPFEPGQVKEVNGQQLVSYGTSSYGYDIRCSDEFKIFTNINSHHRRSEEFRREVVRRLQGRRLHHPAQFLRAGAHGRVLPHSAQRADDLPRQVHLRALRHHRQRHAARARVGRARDPGVLQYHAAAGARSTPTRAWRRCSSSSPTRSARPPTTTAAASTRASRA